MDKEGYAELADRLNAAPVLWCGLAPASGNHTGLAFQCQPDRTGPLWSQMGVCPKSDSSASVTEGPRIFRTLPDFLGSPLLEPRMGAVQIASEVEVLT